MNKSLLTQMRSPALDKIKGFFTACPRCGGRIEKTEHLDKRFTPVTEFRCLEKCGWGKVVA